MTVYQYFLLWYLIPLTLDVIFFFLFRKLVEKIVTPTVFYYWKATFFIPVLNFLQAISFIIDYQK